MTRQPWPRRMIGAFASVVVIAMAVVGVSTAPIVIAATPTVHVGSYYFEDASVGDGTVTAQTGDRLRFVFDTGVGARRHTATVTELGIDSGRVEPGSTWTSPVIATPGTFRLFCTLHDDSQGHETTLIVTGPAITAAPTPAPTPRPTTTASPPPGPSATPGASAPGSPGPSTSATPTDHPSASAAPSGSPTPGASSDGASGPPTGDPSADPSADPSGAVAPSPEPTDDPDQAGSDTPDGPLWFRSLRLALLAGLPIFVAALLAARAASRRST